MAFKSINQEPGTTAHIDIDFLHDATRVYLAYFSEGDTEIYVLLNCGFAMHAPHPTDAQLYIIDVGVSLRDAQTTYPEDNSAASIWTVTVQYGGVDPLEHSPDGNPLNLPLKFRFDGTTEEVPAVTDVSGNPIVNSAGDPYDPPLMRKVMRGTLTITRNEPITISLPTLIGLSNALNAAEWNGFAPLTVQFTPIKLPEIGYSQVTNTFYFPMEYVVDINPDTWIHQVVNAGMRELDADGKLRNILDNEGQPITTPMPLDEDGHAIIQPTFTDGGGDVPDADPDDAGGADGGAEPPEGGTGVISDSNLVIDAYQIDRAADFSVLDLDDIFTLPTL